MSTLNLWVLNDFNTKVTLKDVGSDGKATPMITGPVTAFFATSSSATATAADPSLSMSASHLGNGVWLVTFDAAVLTFALLDPLFNAGGCYLIVQKTGGVRVAFDVTYAAVRPGTVS